MKAPGLRFVLVYALANFGAGCFAATDNKDSSSSSKVSYYRQIRPILQANCQGCHQPAKKKGGYIMTDFKLLLAGGDNEGAAIAPGHADKSSLLKMITPQDGEVRMPKGKAPLLDNEVALIKTWIEQGAEDDTPADAKRHYDTDHPPIYTRPPVVTSIDFSPDGKLLAVAGFHEVLLYDTSSTDFKTTPPLAGRMIGLSERIQSLRFSPDGQSLAVAAGDPARLGEIQVWDVAKRKLTVSAPISYDTLYGVSWSPDSKLIAFGCPDNTVRSVEAVSGKQVVQMGSHSDWPLSTTFSVKGDHIVSGGRDMSVKLTEVASQRFIDNVTSITPGALKGGVLAVATHPLFDHIVAAGSDGLPKVYRIFREVKREIGDDAQFIGDLFPISGRVFSARFSADGKRIACGGGLDRAGEVVISSYDFTNDVPKDLRQLMGKVPGARNADEQKRLDEYKKSGIHEIARIAVPQSEIYSVAFIPDGSKVAAAGSDGMVRLFNAADGKAIAEFVSVPLAKAEIVQSSQSNHIDFIRDVGPVISRLGCNAGTCHGAKEGKNGFKLSLRGYDPETDLRALTDDLASRRVNLASPDDSLMLLKAIAEVPHEGGRRTTIDGKYYKILRQWIAEGANLDLKSPRVVKIEVSPQNPVIEKTGAKQAFTIVATYADKTTRDVTAEAFVETGNADVATADAAVLTTLRRGEAPVLARYEGNYAATTLTVMGDRTGFVWQDSPAWGKIDELVAAKWKRMKIAPSELCTDIEFIRRVYLDLTGLPPSPDQITAFVEDRTETKTKREAVVDKLIGSPEFIDFWANKWADLLECNSKFLGAEGAEGFRAWIRQQVAENTPYDKFAREILTATGSNRERPAASYWKIQRTPTEAMENTTHLFLATRFNCNKCHDHPFERWTQDQYYHLAAYFAQVQRKEDPKSEGKKIGGTAVEGATPLYEMISDAKEGEVKHDRTGKISPPEFPFTAKCDAKEKPTRREQLAEWISSPDNRYFASSYANRLWGYMTGAGIIEPLDDIRAGNPPRNPALLEYLTHEFIDSGFNVHHLMELICKSRTYQLSIRVNKWNEDDKVNYSHALARRLPAETLYDAVFRVTGTTPAIPGAKPGQRAMQLSDAATDDSTGLLATLGRPARQSACECERSSDIRLGSVMALLSGPTVSKAINEPSNALAKLVEDDDDDEDLVNDVFMRILNRPATESETTNALALLAAIQTDNSKITNDLSTLEAKLAPAIADLTRARDEAITKAKTGLGVYDDMTKSLRAELDKHHNAEIAATQRELKEYEKLLPAQAAFWEAKNLSADTKTVWTLVEPQKISATGKVKLTRQSDGSITSSGGKSPSAFVINTRPTLTHITGVMVEVLPDEKLPRFGPGRAPDGNLVLSEIEFRWGAGTNTANTIAKFSDARADYSQPDYNVKLAIDGVVQAGANGWALAGAPGPQRHVATFKLEKPIDGTNGMNVRIDLRQGFGDQFLIGRFRIYLTGAEDPLDFGLPETVALAARAPAGQRTPEQSAAVLDYYRYTDTEFWKRKQAAVAAAMPLPVDPKLAELKGALSTAEQPIHLDPVLVQLREDAKASVHQTENKRLTVVQDLAWALINSAGFLFNH
jgi:WD40 repeat protein